MRLDEILDTVRTSPPEAWETLDASTVRSWGYGEKRVSGIEGMVPYVEPSTHHTLAIYKSDIDISLAWGATHRGDYHAPWMPKNPFPDKSVSSIFVDLRYRGQVVANWIMIYLDGSRFLIPTPDLVPGSFDDEARTAKWYVPQREMDFGRLFAALVVSGSTRAADDSESALRRIGVEIQRSPTP